MVGLRKRIVFVIVAAIARHRETKKRAGGRFSQVSHQFGAAAVLLVKCACRIVMRPQSQIARGNQRILLRVVLRCAFQQLIASQVFDTVLTRSTT